MAEILSGFDLYTVLEGSTHIDISPLFAGGGTIRSNGVPVDPDRLGRTSTAIERKTGLPDGRSGVVEVEMFMEHSKSIEPVRLSDLGLGDGFADWHTVINRGGLLHGLPNTDGYIEPSLGVMAILRNGERGGTTELMMNINPLIVLTKVGGSIVDLKGPDIIKLIPGNGLLNPVGSAGARWSETRFDRAVRDARFESGNFFSAASPGTGRPVVNTWTSGPTVSAVRNVTLSIV